METPGDTKNITVANCTLSSSTCATRVGYGGDGPPIKNCVFSNLAIHDSRMGIDILSVLPETNLCTGITKGARIEGLVFSDIVMDNVKRPIYIWQGNESGGTFMGKIEDVSINNVIARAQDSVLSAGYPAILSVGLV